MNPVFAVCDVETDYAIRFMEYLNRRNLPFEIQMYTEVEPLCAYGRKKHIELLLISERAMCDEVRALHVGKLILLAEDRGALQKPETSVYKYQSSAQVVREVLDCYSAQRAATHLETYVASAPARMIGVYGLVEPSLQMLFALSLGQILAETESVLYLHLQKRAGFSLITGEEIRTDLSDLLFCYRRAPGSLPYRMSGMLHKIGRMDILPAPGFPEDLGEMSAEEWRGFLEEIAASGVHSILLLDLGDGVRGLPGILRRCGSRILLSGEDAFSVRRRASLEEELELEGGEANWYAPPSVPEIRAGRWFAESLPDTELGDYVRRNCHA